MLGDSPRLANVLVHVGLAASARAELDRARTLLEDAVVGARQTGQLGLLAADLCYLARLDLESGDAGQAQHRAEQALRSAAAAGHTEIACHASAILGELEYRAGRLDSARRVWEDALAQVRETHQQHVHVIPALIDVGRLAVEQDERDRARLPLGEALVFARELSRLYLVHALEAVVELAAAEQQIEKALELAGAATALRDAKGMPLWPSERARLEPLVARMRQSLNQAAGDAAWMRGWSAPADRTLALALDFLQVPLGRRRYS